MSLFSWLFAKPKPKSSLPPGESSGLSRMEATRPVNGRPGRPAADAAAQGNAQPANRKGERMARRELLYGVVREAMMRAGVLTASYKFKVLSLDARGRQFLVMVDLAREAGGETARLAEIEALIAQGAKARYDIVVTSVYWRMNEHVAVGAPSTRPVRGTTSRPTPLETAPAVAQVAQAAQPRPAEPAVPPVSQPAPLGPTARGAAPAAPAQPVPNPQPPAGSGYEPIDADEVAAFRQALAAGISRPAVAPPETGRAPVAPVAATAAAAATASAAAAAGGASARSFNGAGVHGPQSYTLLTGFEDTEMPDQEVHMPALSATQYGDLN